MVGAVHDMSVEVRHLTRTVVDALHTNIQSNRRGGDEGDAGADADDESEEEVIPGAMRKKGLTKHLPPEQVQLKVRCLSSGLRVY